VLGAGLLSLVCADVIRPGLAWLLATATPKRLAAEMARARSWRTAGGAIHASGSRSVRSSWARMRASTLSSATHRR
jgi:hypothetical protein